MRTDELIDALAADLRPAPARMVPLRMAWVALAGGAIALGLVAFWLGFRPDLGAALGSAMFWMKAGYAAILGLAGFLALERLARPAGAGRLGLALAAAAILLFVAVGAAQLLLAPADLRLSLWLGQSWRRCPITILALSVPMLIVTLVVVRAFAPTRLALAGGAAGLFCGGVAAAAYGLHCPETAPAFVATWYSLGVALPTAVGGLVGRWALRWR